MKSDGIVIGGGPAGSSAAIRLARTGRRIQLYEKSFFPRQKLCGGYVSSEAIQDLEDLGVMESLGPKTIPLHRTVIAAQDGSIIDTPLSAPAFSISRDTFDSILLEKAEQAGVEVIHGEDGFRYMESTPLTVIAAGRLASARQALRQKQMRPWYASPSTSYFGLQALFRDVQGVTDQVELDLVKNGYVGLARQTEGVNVCALTTQEMIRQHGPSLDHIMAQWINENRPLRNHLQGSTRLTSWMSVGPVQLGIRRLTGPNMFYVGDAACVVDPFAGEGMAMSLYTSHLLIHALEQTQEPAEAAYTASWCKAFMPALRWNAAMRALYSIPLLREPTLRALGWFPQGMQWLTDLTRYRRLETV